MASGKVIGGVFLAADELLGMKQLAVRAGPHLVDDGGLQIHENRTWDVLSGAGLAEEGVESVVSASDGLVARHLSIWLKKCENPQKKSTIILHPQRKNIRSGKNNWRLFRFAHLNTVFEAVELPAGVSDLDPGLTDVDRNALSHFRWLIDCLAC